MSRACLSVLACCALVGCDLKPPHAVVRVEDPHGLALGADVLAAGLDDQMLEPLELEGRAFPLSFVVSHPEPITAELWVEARLASQALARGRIALELKEGSASNLTVVLGAACASDAECSDGVYCNGVESCERGVCLLSPAPCAPLAAACVTTVCNEAAAGCEVTLDHSQCVAEEYCDPIVGCAPGARCDDDEACADGLVCDGDERCIGGRCAPGPAPTVDDADLCNLDACVEPSGAVHYQDPNSDGRYCGDAAICVSGLCTSSVCGDGIFDARSEECDDANDNPGDGCAACRLPNWQGSLLVGLDANAGDPRTTNITPSAIAPDREGNLYIADEANNQVLRYDAALDTISVVAGVGTRGFSGDGGPATSAELSGPASLAVDVEGNLYLGDAESHRIRRVDANTLEIATVAGTGVAGNSGDMVPGVIATLDAPFGLTVSRIGNVCFSDREQHMMRCLGVVSFITSYFAGTGSPGFSGDGGNRRFAQLDHPRGILDDPFRGVVIADTGNRRVRLIDTNENISTLVGDGSDAMVPYDVTVLSNGSLLIADAPHHTIRSRGLTLSVMRIVAGDGTPGSSGDGGPPISARLNFPVAVETGRDDQIFVAEQGGHRVRLIDTAQDEISTLVGSGRGGTAGDGRPATAAQLGDPCGLAIDAAGGIWVSDKSGALVRRVDPQTGVIETVAGGQALDPSNVDFGDGALAILANFDQPRGIALDPGLDLFVADYGHDRIRKLTASTGLISTLLPAAGTPALTGPGALSFEPGGTLLYSDDGHSVFRVGLAATSVSLLAGDAAGPDADGIAATAARLSPIAALSAGPGGASFVAEAQRVRRVDAGSGLISTVAGGPTPGFSGDGGPATAARLDGIVGMAVDAAGNLAILDGGNARLRWVDVSTGRITTLAGTGVRGGEGDGGPATAAAIDPGLCGGVAIDGRGDVLFVDAGNQRVRKVERGSGLIRTVVGAVDGRASGAMSRERFAGPEALAAFDDGNVSGWLVSDGSGRRLVLADTNSGRLIPVAGYPLGLEQEGAEARYSRLLDQPSGLAVDRARDRIYLSERGGHVIRAIDTSSSPWRITTFAGARGQPDHVDGPLAAARFSAPAGLYLDTAEAALYVADAGNHVVRRIDLAALRVDTVAGRPHLRGFGGDGGPALAAVLHSPQAVVHASGGNLYVADTGNHRVRRVDNSGRIDTVLGDGSAASSGEGAPSRAFPVDSPRGMALDAAGNLYVTSRTTLRVLIAGSDGRVSGDGRVIRAYGDPFASHPPESLAHCITGLALDDPNATRILFVDRCSGVLLAITRQ